MSLIITPAIRICFVPSSLTSARFLRPSLPSLHKIVIVALEFRQAHALLVKLSLSFLNFLLLSNLLYGDFTSSYEFTASVRKDISLETARILGRNKNSWPFQPVECVHSVKAMFFPIQIYKILAQCLNNDWQFARATCKFNSNFLDQVAKFRLSFDKFCCHFSGINSNSTTSVPETERKKKNTPL